MTDHNPGLCEPGDLFLDKDRARGERPFRVVCIIRQPEHAVRKPTAVCIVRGKVTAVGLDRLLDPSRFVKSYPLACGEEGAP